MRLITFISFAILITLPSLAQVPVSGYVLSLGSGNMVAGANVRILSESGLPFASQPMLQTNAEGHFLFEDVPAGAYMLEVAHTYTAEGGSLRYEVRTDRFAVADKPSTLAVGMSRAHALLELEISETDREEPYPVSMLVRRQMLSPQIRLDQPGRPLSTVDVVSAVVGHVN